MHGDSQASVVHGNGSLRAVKNRSFSNSGWLGSPLSYWPCWFHVHVAQDSHTKCSGISWLWKKTILEHSRKMCQCVPSFGFSLLAPPFFVAGNRDQTQTFNRKRKRELDKSSAFKEISMWQECGNIWEEEKKNDQGNIYCPLALIFSWESLGKLHNHLDSVALSLVMCKTIAPMCWGKGGRSIYHLRTHRTPGFRISSPWTAHCLWAVFKAELVCNQ